MSRQEGYEAGWLEAGRLEPWEPWELWLHWYCTGEAVGVLASLVLLWGGCGSPGFTDTALGGCGSLGFTGTALGRLWEPWLHWYCTGEAMGALASLVLHWGDYGSPSFAGTALGGCESPGFAGTALGRLWEPWLHWYCTGFFGKAVDDAPLLGMMTGCPKSSWV